ncbi:hypothetical protein [Sporolactobacillus putidus]|uniref:Uncharacterized protein n=1 Tax=Sporolactobacillus putidus TaxID=492735 RepID=A0A917RZ19_9BACL|nr:hypothetical protein [Sporolactobacillus putidus]GGL43210.1 hypothetical protein GCM10007968_03920 [Sporolactobacillus putidus]
MNLEWYLFEQSYLMDIKYDPLGCTLKLEIDAKITFEHPDSANVSNMEDSFKEIIVQFEGVQYLRLISSLNLLTNPNDDFGSIEQFHLKNSDSIIQEFVTTGTDGTKILSLGLSGDNVATVNTKSKEIKFVDFISEMISFELGFEGYTIKEKK